MILFGLLLHVVVRHKELMELAARIYALRDEHIEKNGLYPMPGAVELFNEIYGKYGDKCEILTGIPKPKRGILTAADDKIAWAHRILSPTLKVNIVYREEKKNYCKGKDSILIDDLRSNIDDWISYGGTGILHISAGSTGLKLREMDLL